VARVLAAAGMAGALAGRNGQEDGMTRFTLDEDKAREWLAEHAPPGHAPADYEWRVATCRMICHAVDAGVICDPLHRDAETLALEIRPGWVAAGPSYRWLLSIDTGPGPDDYLTLASPADELDALTGETGGRGAMDVLRAAVTAGNVLAEQLDRYVAARAAAAETEG
jgi:hypothetical protein